MKSFIPCRHLASLLIYFKVSITEFCEVNTKTFKDLKIIYIQFRDIKEPINIITNIVTNVNYCKG